MSGENYISIVITGHVNEPGVSKTQTAFVPVSRLPLLVYFGSPERS